LDERAGFSQDGNFDFRHREDRAIGNYGLPLGGFAALHGDGSLIEKKRFPLTVPDENNMFSTI